MRRPAAPWNTHRQAQLSANLAREERRPEIRLSFPQQNDGAHTELQIQNRSGAVVHHVTVELTRRPIYPELTGYGFGTDATATTTSIVISDLEPGHPTFVDFWIVAAELWADRTVTFLVTPHDGDRPWRPHHVDVELTSGDHRATI